MNSFLFQPVFVSVFSSPLTIRLCRSLEQSFSLSVKKKPHVIARLPENTVTGIFKNVRACTPRSHTLHSASSRTPVLVVVACSELAQIQLAGGILAQVSTHNALGKSAMSDVRTTNLVSFKTGGRPILSNGNRASSA